MNHVKAFGGGTAEGRSKDKALLGGKGANLAEMTNLGVPVPPGFTIACDVCITYLRDRIIPDALRSDVEASLTRLEVRAARRSVIPQIPCSCPCAAARRCRCPA